MYIDWANIFDVIIETQDEIKSALDDLPKGKVVTIAKLASSLGYDGDDARKVFGIAIEGMVNKGAVASDGIEVCAG